MCSTWTNTKVLIQRNPKEFKNAVRRVFQTEFGEEFSDLEVYVDDDAVMVVVGEEVYVNTEDDPMLLIGNIRAVNIAILSGEISSWEGTRKRCA